ncbi:MAG: hypothetical protein M0C28_35535 [Candidatus Moduliflexus flocculans]|nr:hypothetical protein [Candidatus Moduliflexus flocculans]
MFGDLAWSPDSRWLAYVQGASNGFSQIVLLEAETGRTAELTNDRVDSYNPAWSPDGKWLYFLSDRWFRSAVGSPWGPRQPEPYFDKTTKIYAAGLSGKDPFPFAPATELEAEKKENGEEKPAEAKPKPSAGKAAKEPEKPAPSVKVAVELAGIQDRVFEVPLPAERLLRPRRRREDPVLRRRGLERRGPAQAPGRRDQEPQRPGQDAHRGRPELRALGRRQEAPRPQGRRRLRHRRRDGPADRADPGRAPRRPLQVDLLRRPARGVAADVRRRLAHGARLLLRPQPPQRRLPRACSSGTGRSSTASATGPSSTTSWPTSSASSRPCTPSSAAAT